VCPECGKMLTGSASKGRHGGYYHYYHCGGGCRCRFKTGLYQTVSRDAYGYSLGYYSGDYSPIGTTSATAFNVNYAPAPNDPTGQNLYNGNINSQILSVSAFSSGTPTGYTYHYDQLNRLKNMRFHTGITSTFSTGSISPNYKEDVTYDENGNILTYLRNGSNGAPIDDLIYNYSRDVNG